MTGFLRDAAELLLLGALLFLFIDVLSVYIWFTIERVSDWFSKDESPKRD